MITEADALPALPTPQHTHTQSDRQVTLMFLNLELG